MSYFGKWEFNRRGYHLNWSTEVFSHIQKQLIYCSYTQKKLFRESFHQKEIIQKWQQLSNITWLVPKLGEKYFSTQICRKSQKSNITFKITGKRKNIKLTYHYTCTFCRAYRQRVRENDTAQTMSCAMAGKRHWLWRCWIEGRHTTSDIKENLDVQTAKSTEAWVRTAGMAQQWRASVEDVRRRSAATARQ